MVATCAAFRCSSARHPCARSSAKLKFSSAKRSMGRRCSSTPGKVDHGFTPDDAEELQKKRKRLIRKTQSYTKRIAHRGIWVEPELLAEIEHRAKSAEGKLRHPFFKGLREDLE